MTNLTATEYCGRLLAEGLTYTAEFVPLSKSRNADTDWQSINWRVTLARRGASLTTDYAQGVAHIPHFHHVAANRRHYAPAVAEACETGRSRLVRFAPSHGGIGVRAERLKPPALADVLSCLVSDASALDYACFEDWAAEFGYDPDSRKGERAYRECLETALKLRQLIDLDEAREAFQDY